MFKMLDRVSHASQVGKILDHLRLELRDRLRNVFLLGKNTKDFIERIECIKKCASVDERQVMFELSRDTSTRPFLSLKTDLSLKMNLVRVLPGHDASALLFDNASDFRSAL